MSTKRVYFYEFLYRGVSPGDPTSQDAWHVKTITETTEDDGTKTHAERVYSAGQALAAGITLPSVLSSVNLSLAAENEASRGLLLELAEAAQAATPEDSVTPAPAVDPAPGLMARIWSFLTQ